MTGDMVEMGNKITMLVRGASPSAPCNITGVRTLILFDTMYRYLTYAGHDVSYIRTIDDLDDSYIPTIDDQIMAYKIASAFKMWRVKLILSGDMDDEPSGKVFGEGLVHLGYDTPYENAEMFGDDINVGVIPEPGAARFARKYGEFPSLMTDLGVLPPTLEIRASENIEATKDMLKKLEEKGLLYFRKKGEYFGTKGGVVYLKSEAGLLAHRLPARLIPNMLKIGTLLLPPPQALLISKLPEALWFLKEDLPSWHSDWGKGQPGYPLRGSLVLAREQLKGTHVIYGGSAYEHDSLDYDIRLNRTAYGSDRVQPLILMIHQSGRNYHLDPRKLLDQYGEFVVRYWILRIPYDKKFDSDLHYAEQQMRRLFRSLNRAKNFLDGKKVIKGGGERIPGGHVMDLHEFRSLMSSNFQTEEVCLKLNKNSRELDNIMSEYEAGNRLSHEKVYFLMNLTEATEEILSVLGLKPPCYKEALGNSQALGKSLFEGVW